ncbi:leucine-rich repeat domain-containing protein [Pandoraea iniqua]|nr:hypothetical protein [Pandoraea iniqua]
MALAREVAQLLMILPGASANLALNETSHAKQAFNRAVARMAELGVSERDTDALIRDLALWMLKQGGIQNLPAGLFGSVFKQKLLGIGTPHEYLACMQDTRLRYQRRASAALSSAMMEVLTARKPLNYQDTPMVVADARRNTSGPVVSLPGEEASASTSETMRLKGAIRDEELKGLPASLEELDLSACHGITAEGMAHLSKLERLTSLKLGAAQKAKLPEILRALTQHKTLRRLDLSSMSLTSSDVPAILELKQVTSLNLSHNGIGNVGVRCLAQMRQLVSLDLGHNAGISDISGVADLQYLTRLNLSDNAMRFDGMLAMRNMHQLTELNLCRNRIGDEGANVISQLPNLRVLNVSRNEVSAQGAQTLKSLAYLTTLDVSRNDIGDEGGLALATLSQLTSLNVSSCELSDVSAKAIFKLERLESVDISANSIGDESVCVLQGHQRLQRLTIAANRVGDPGAQVLASLTQLRYLDANGNKIDEVGAKALGEREHFVFLDLVNNYNVLHFRNVRRRVERRGLFEE